MRNDFPDLAELQRPRWKKILIGVYRIITLIIISYVIGVLFAYGMKNLEESLLMALSKNRVEITQERDKK